MYPAVRNVPHPVKEETMAENVEILIRGGGAGGRDVPVLRRGGQARPWRNDPDGRKRSGRREDGGLPPLSGGGGLPPLPRPLTWVAHRVGPALAAGCPLVLKPASTTPLTAIRLGEILEEAGLPPGVLNVVVGPGGTVGEWMTTDPRIAKISFTGGPPVGGALLRQAGRKKRTNEP